MVCVELRFVNHTTYIASEYKQAYPSIRASEYMQTKLPIIRPSDYMQARVCCQGMADLRLLRKCVECVVKKLKDHLNPLTLTLGHSEFWCIRFLSTSSVRIETYRPS